MKNKTLPLIAALAFCAVSAFGFSRTDQGTWTAGGSFFFDPASAWGSDIELNLTLGYYLEYGLMVGGYASLRDNDFITTISAGATGKYHFLDDGSTPFSPFVGADAGLANYQTSDDDTMAIAIGVRLGLDYFLTEHVAIEAAVDAHAATDKIYTDDDGGSSTDVTVKIGLLFFW